MFHLARILIISLMVVGLVTSCVYREDKGKLPEADKEGFKQDSTLYHSLRDQRLEWLGEQVAIDSAFRSAYREVTQEFDSLAGGEMIILVMDEGFTRNSSVGKAEKTVMSMIKGSEEKYSQLKLLLEEDSIQFPVKSEAETGIGEVGLLWQWTADQLETIKPPFLAVVYNNGSPVQEELDEEEERLLEKFLRYKHLAQKIQQADEKTKFLREKWMGRLN